MAAGIRKLTQRVPSEMNKSKLYSVGVALSYQQHGSLWKQLRDITPRQTYAS